VCLGSVAVTVALAGCGLIRAPGSTWGTPTGLASITPQAAASPAAVSRPVVPVSALKDPSRKFFGLEASGAPDNISPVTSVAEALSVNPNLIGQYVSWGRPFDTMAAANALNAGALYYMVWEPFKPSVASIADGASDAYITKFARAVHAFGKPVALSFGHEMNGNWYPWGTTGTTAADFVAAWRHIHQLFTQAGATNVIWVWNPNIINPMPDVQLQPYWPGSSYVDWVGITGYFAITGPHTFDGVYGPTMTEIRQFTSKPFFIAETAVETGANELNSISSLIGSVKDHSDVLGFVWFNYSKDGVDWTLGDRPKARAAVASALDGMPLMNLHQ
jgi:mannan endo-1,4-beta-mannosidase